VGLHDSNAHSSHSGSRSPNLVVSATSSMIGGVSSTDLLLVRTTSLLGMLSATAGKILT